MNADSESTSRSLSVRRAQSVTLRQNSLVTRGLQDIARLGDRPADPETQFMFGQMFMDGDGVEQDYSAAAHWFRIAGESGHAGAQHNLALMCENGKGVPQDYSEAAIWYRMAANQGHAGSQNNLGVLFETGRGIAQNNFHALELYRMGAGNGDKNARENYQRLKSRLEESSLRDHYSNIVCAFCDLIESNMPLIGDCSMLPYPKRTILYALRWLMDYWESKRETAADQTLIDRYDNLVETNSYLFTHLGDDWHDLESEDKVAIAELNKCDSFPDWALPLKRKYINEETARNEALGVVHEVVVDRVYPRGNPTE
jgi:hypothetical protein